MPLNHSGWSAWISVDGEELPQYSVKVEEDPGSVPRVSKSYTVSCWIPSKVGKEFLVNIDYSDSTTQRKTDVTADLKVDNHSVGGHVYKILWNRFPEIIKGYIESDGETVRPLVFTALNLTDEEVGDNSVNLNALGTIQLTMKRVEFLDWTEPNFGSTSTPKGLSSTSRVHEKTKKAGCHRVTLGEARKLPQPQKFCKTRNIDDGPFLTFIFYYRSTDILRAQEIIPPLAAPQEDSLALGGKSNPIKIEDEGVNLDSEISGEIRVLEEKLNILKNIKKRKGKKSNLKASSRKPKIEDDVKPIIN
ncbi:hypothetical protein M422DRAFT_63961 [Sphaerobolus stellatus SS14]|nr:hypothetical protein M422DRAFT_63961 [Sphaerobolus stellatus SS14]